MAAKILLLVAFLALSHAALVKRDAATPSPFEDLQKHAADFQKTFTEQINQFVSSKNTEEVNKSLKEGADAVVQQLTTFASSLQTAIADATGKAKDALVESKANIEKAAEDLRKSHPEVEQQANALRERITTAVQTSITETQKLAKELVDNAEQANQKLQPQVQAAYQSFVKQVEEVQKKVHEAATKQ